MIEAKLLADFVAVLKASNLGELEFRNVEGLSGRIKEPKPQPSATYPKLGRVSAP